MKYEIELDTVFDSDLEVTIENVTAYARDYASRLVPPHENEIEARVVELIGPAGGNPLVSYSSNDYVKLITFISEHEASFEDAVERINEIKVQ